jgi:hypothetical protein
VFGQAAQAAHGIADYMCIDEQVIPPYHYSLTMFLVLNLPGFVVAPWCKRCLGQLTAVRGARVCRS